jgi:hypothetical protein
MIGGRKVRSNKGKRRGPYGSRKTNTSGRTRSGARFRGRNVSRKNNKSKRARKVRSNKGKKRKAYGPRNTSGRTRSGAKFRPRRRPRRSSTRKSSQNNNNH